MSASVPSTSQAESRKGKPGLSCAECRRSKLKCDRIFPCQSCIRRGCAAICPDGTLAATKGNKVLMAHAQRLTEQVKAMSARIKQLEASLADAQIGPLPFAALGDEPAVSRRSSQDGEWIDVKHEGDMDNMSKGLGSLAIDGEGKAQYYGETAGAEYLQHLMPLGVEVGNTSTIQEPKYLGLPSEVLELVYAFPFGFPDRAHIIADFIKYIPCRERAVGLAELYYTHAAWIFDPITRSDFEHNILEPLYSSVNDPVTFVHFEPHRLSVFFMVLGIGALFDPHPDARITAERYHAFACATFSLESIVGGATCASIQALLMMEHFLFSTDRSGNERRWLLSGLCTKVIHMGCVRIIRKLFRRNSEPHLRLERDSAGWNLNEEENQRRRTIFWEFFTWECWACVIHGRPFTINLAHSDCRFPRDLDPYQLPSGTSELGFHSWKFRYSAVCLSASVQHTFSVYRESYSSILELDKRIRTFPIPSHLLSPAHETGGRDWDANPSTAMRQFFAACDRESNLIYIHRSWFAEALRDSPDPLQHEYGQSVVTVYRSANTLINGMTSLTSTHPNAAGRVWFFWSNIYTSSVLLGAIVVKSPGCKLAQSALALLDQSFTLYEEGSALCRPPATVSMLQRLRNRAHYTYSTFCSNISGGSQIPLPPTHPDDIHDLSAFGGTKGSVISKSPSSSPPGSGAPSPGSCPSAASGDIPANSAYPQHSSHSPASLPCHSPLTYSSSGSSPLHQPDGQVMTQISYGSIPRPIQQPQFGLPYPADQDTTPTQRAPDFQPSMFVPQDQSLLPSFETGYSVSQETVQFHPTAQEGTHQQNPLASMPVEEGILDFDFEALGLPPVPQQQPMRYNQYPQLQQFQDVFMGGDPSVVQPAQIPMDDVWWKFVDDLGIQRI